MRIRLDLGSYSIIRSMHHILFNKPSLVSFSQESEVHNNTQSLGESISGVVHDLCSCNFTSANLEDPQLTCSDDGNMIIFTTTVVYSSDTGDITASDMIDMVKSWAAINGVGTSLEIGGDMATVSQVCSPSCESPSLSSPSTLGENYVGTVAAGTFIGGLIVGIIFVAIPVIIVW